MRWSDLSMLCIDQQRPQGSIVLIIHLPKAPKDLMASVCPMLAVSEAVAGLAGVFEDRKCQGRGKGKEYGSPTLSHAPAKPHRDITCRDILKGPMEKDRALTTWERALLLIHSVLRAGCTVEQNEQRQRAEQMAMFCYLRFVRFFFLDFLLGLPFALGC